MPIHGFLTISVKLLTHLQQTALSWQQQPRNSVTIVTRLRSGQPDTRFSFSDGKYILSSQQSFCPGQQWIESDATTHLYLVQKDVPLKPSGCYIFTTRFSVKNNYILPKKCIYVFCILEQTAIISLYSINRSVFL